MKKHINFFDEQISEAQILMKEIGIRDFSTFVRICVQEKIRSNAKIIKKYKDKKQK